MIELNIKKLIAICPDQNAKVTITYWSTDLWIEWLLTSKFGVECAYRQVIQSRQIGSEMFSIGDVYKSAHSEMTEIYDNLRSIAQ